MLSAKDNDVFEGLACMIKSSADNTLKHFSYFSQKIGFDIFLFFPENKV